MHSAIATFHPTCSPEAETLDVAFLGHRGFTTARGSIAIDGVEPEVPEPVAAGEVVALRRYDLSFSLDGGETETRVAPFDVAASLEMAGTSVPVKVSLNGANGEVTLPDIAGPAQLVVKIALNSAPCRSAQARVVFAMDLVASTVAAACPVSREAYIDVLQSLDPRIRIGSAVERMTMQSFEARYASAAGIDEVPAFAGFDPRRTPVIAEAGKSIAMSMIASDLELTAATIATWRRSDVVDGHGSLKQDYGERIDVRTASAPVGRIAWRVPREPGDYVLGIYPAWTAACMTGGGYLSASLTVR